MIFDLEEGHGFCRWLHNVRYMIFSMSLAMGSDGQAMKVIPTRCSVA